MSDTIRIKRRTTGASGAPSSLANAELAYSEVDDIGYYGKGTGGTGGSATTVVPAFGSGAFVDKTSAQTVAGAKTFSVSPQVPTATAGDSSANAASTAFVAAATAPVAVAANTVHAGPTSGANANPTYRALVPADIPTLTSSKVSDFSAAADARIAAQKGAALGLCPLDSNSLVPAAYLPSYVDDVLEFSTLSAFPTTGESGKIYVTDDTEKTYRWSGSIYIEISASPGSTDAVPEGATNLYFTMARVLATVLTGFSSATATAVAATDTILAAIGKLQGQVSARLVIANNLSDVANVVTARSNLGLGSMALQSSSSVAITGGTIDGITFDGGTF